MASDTPKAVRPIMGLTQIDAMLTPHYLEILGGFHCDSDPSLPAGTKTLLLVGPKEPGFWSHLQTQPEWDGAPDPIDRWSRRVIGTVACALGAKALFPFGGPPYHPFYQWAIKTGHIWDSPVRLLVHSRQGLMVSFRGALALKDRIDVFREMSAKRNRYTEDRREVLK